MKQHSKLRQGETQETSAEEQVQQTSETKEFSSVEEMLRFDAAQHPPPASVASRLMNSISREAKPPWWKRFWKG